MNHPQIFVDKERLADAVARQTIEALNLAITSNGHASWVLAGGTTPELAYAAIATSYLDQVDWTKVTFVIGDERIGPLYSPDNNWHAIEESFLHLVPQASFLRPHSGLTPEAAADEYTEQLKDIDHFDIVWLGMGEDGHTLSLFPGHPDFQPTNRRVIPVYDSPKPPSERISLTLHALSSATTTYILASGEAKAEAVEQAFQPNSQLPIAQAARTTNATWFLDHAAASALA